MRKVLLPLTVGTLGAGALAVWYYTNKNKDINRHVVELAKAGIPDQLDLYDDAHFENTKMMSEGSHYGIDYFNEQRTKQ